MKLIYRPDFTMEYVKLQVVKMALAYHGTREKAAQALGITARTIYNILNEKTDEIQEPEPKRNSTQSRKPRVRRKNKGKTV